jgi:signal recognition particle subunit SRP54
MDERDLIRVTAIIDSMTPRERQNPKIINGSRRKRISAGSGTSVPDVNRLLKQFEEARKVMRMMGKGRGRGRLPF